MRASWVSLLVLLSLLTQGGCSKPQRGGPRFKTSPVTGTVLVDGNPQEMVEVTCHPDPASTTIKYPVVAMVDKDGKFSLGTYEGNDGLPEGTYKLTFKWLEPGLVLKDKLKGAYDNPQKTEYSVTVKADKGEKIDAGLIDLKTKK